MMTYTVVKALKDGSKFVLNYERCLFFGICTNTEFINAVRLNDISPYTKDGVHSVLRDNSAFYNAVQTGFYSIDKLPLYSSKLLIMQFNYSTFTNTDLYFLVPVSE